MFLKKIKDIKISNEEISVTRKAKFFTIDLENQILNLTYSGTGLPKQENVESAFLPPFIQVFYYLFFKELTIPTEKKFFDTYLEWLGGNNNGKIIYEHKEYDAVGVENRLKRTYPSLIRDLHFLYLVEESKKFDHIEYSMEIDYYNGLDLKVIYRNSEYFISLFIDTTRGRYYKYKKTTRHDFSEIEEIVFNVDFASLNKIGDFYLLNFEHVNLLEEMIKSKQI
jgi:hypothetical protein